MLMTEQNSLTSNPKIFSEINHLRTDSLNEQVLLDHIKKNIEDTECALREFDNLLNKKIEKLRSIERDLKQGNERYRNDINRRLRRIYEIMNEL